MPAAIRRLVDGVLRSCESVPSGDKPRRFRLNCVVQAISGATFPAISSRILLMPAGLKSDDDDSYAFGQPPPTDSVGGWPDMWTPLSDASTFYLWQPYVV